jgi:hypothetical protein
MNFERGRDPKESMQIGLKWDARPVSRINIKIRDFEIKGRVSRATPSDADFFLRCIASGARKHCGQYDEKRRFAVAVAIKLKNENLRKQAEYFFKDFEFRFKEDMENSVSGKIFMNIPFLKQKMIEEFYPDVPEYFDTFENCKSLFFSDDIYYDRELI